MLSPYQFDFTPPLAQSKIQLDTANDNRIIFHSQEHTMHSLHNTDVSYFTRTNWFIWIGFVSSLLMFLLVGWSMAQTWNTPPDSPTFLPVMLFFGAGLGFLFFSKKKIQSYLVASNTDDAAVFVSLQGKVTLYYTLTLLALWAAPAISFIVGSLSKNFGYMAVPLGAGLVIIFATNPKLFIRA